MPESIGGGSSVPLDARWLWGRTGRDGTGVWPLRLSVACGQGVQPLPCRGGACGCCESRAAMLRLDLSNLSLHSRGGRYAGTCRLPGLPCHLEGEPECSCLHLMQTQDTPWALGELPIISSSVLQPRGCPGCSTSQRSPLPPRLVRVMPGDRGAA